MDIIKIIAKNIHDIRIEKNISLQELSEKTGIDLEKLKRLGTGTNSGLNITHYIDIADKLEVTLEEVTKGIDFVDD